MYGTIAHFRLRPGGREEFIQMMDSFGSDVIPGWKADYYFRNCSRQGWLRQERQNGLAQQL